MKKNYNLLFVLLLMFIVSIVGTTISSAEKPFSEPMAKLEPFVGKWKTQSITPGSSTPIPGDLEYRWVLGKGWLFVEFVGQHPRRPVWEAYAMIKYDPAKKCYISYDFFNADDPIVMTGTWISADTIRFEAKTPQGKTTTAIDYKIKSDGTIYQQNWRVDTNNKWEITLKTDYTKK